jgi:hypothetical protein
MRNNINVGESIQWNSLGEFFQAINATTNYLVIRNYEEYVNDRILSEHKDIDILCDEPQLFRTASKAIPRQAKDDGIHYYIMVNDCKIELDIRWIGDGYYDNKWEQIMLNNRVSFSNLFYVMDKESYYWSLLYHALIHKKSISKDYQAKLSVMAIELNIKDKNLDDYMRLHGYKYTYPARHFLKKTKSIIKHIIKWEKK